MELMHALPSQMRQKAADEPRSSGERAKSSCSAPSGLASRQLSFVARRSDLGSDSGMKSVMMRKLSTPTAAAAYMGARRPYCAESTAESGMPRIKAPATDRPWKTPRRTARFSGGEASAT